MLIKNKELNNMTKSEFNSIDHTKIWLWKVEKEMRAMRESFSMWNDARFEHLQCLADEMREKGVKFLRIE